MALVRRLRHAVFFPDDQVGWAPFAVRAALRAHRAAPMDAIFSTSSPVSAHLIGGLVHRATGLPWVVEFRDPWVGNVIEGRQPWMVDRLRRRLERWIVRNAAEVVCVTPTLARIYQERYPAARVTLVPNGYDRAERVDRSPDAGGDGRFRLVFTGTLDRPPELETFLTGIDRLVRRRPEMADRLRVTFYGLVSQECRVLADRMLAGGPLATIATFAGFVPRAEAVRAVADADAALVLLGEGPGMELFIGGKLYDYLGQDRQIFAMVPRGDAREVLAGLDWGIVADPDPASVELALERLIETPRPDRPADPEGRYDRAVLAGRLAAVLDRSVEARGSGSTMDDAR
jgi:glycosyltransferase involved in cell wall biosynthesis